jgi:hypothetical protein
MAGKGGHRPGAGRPSKADEQRVRDLSVQAIAACYGSEEAGFKALLQSQEPALIKFVFEHAYGKPKERHELVGKDGATLFPSAPVTKLPDGTILEI